MFTELRKRIMFAAIAPTIPLRRRAAASSTRRKRIRMKMVAVPVTAGTRVARVPLPKTKAIGMMRNIRRREIQTEVGHLRTITLGIVIAPATGTVATGAIKTTGQATFPIMTSILSIHKISLAMTVSTEIMTLDNSGVIVDKLIGRMTAATAAAGTEDRTHEVLGANMAAMEKILGGSCTENDGQVALLFCLG
jgi:hypothetical protein